MTKDAAQLILCMVVTRESVQASPLGSRTPDVIHADL